MWQNSYNAENVTIDEFDSLARLKDYLVSFLCNLNKFCEHNIYIHQVNDNYDKVQKISGGRAVKNRVKNIIKNGFSISKYSSISGTTKLIGSTKQLDVNDLLNYEYYRKAECRSICVIAIPKYVLVNGEYLEYSSFNGLDAWSFPEELTQEYLKHLRSKPELHHYKCSLFDAIKNYQELPSCYLLGVVQIEDDKDIYKFVNPHTHLSFVSKETVDQHDKKIESLIIRLCKKYQTKDIKKIIVETYKENQVYYSQVDDFEL